MSKLVPIEEFDRLIWDLVQKRISNPWELIQTLSTTNQQLDQEAGTLATQDTRLTIELELLDAQAEQIWHDQKENDWPVAWVKPKLNDLAKKRSKAQTQLDQVRSRRSSIKMSQDAMRENAVLLDSYQQGITDATTEQKREYIRMLAVRDECCIRTIMAETPTGRKMKEIEVDLVLRWYGSANNTVFPYTGIAAPAAPCGRAA